MRKSIIKVIVVLTSAFIFSSSLSQANSSGDPIRISCVGNSITEGAGLGFDTYPAALGRYLGSRYLVKNYGVSGRTMLKKGDYPIWNEALFSQALTFNPNIVTIALGTNDSKPYNWIYKDEFISDYIAMIDTFKQLPTHPEIYACLPLPSFSDAYDIRDSVIVADIIPMIRKIADSTGVHLIDLNTPFLDKSDLLPDGIHPMVEGADLIARIIYKELTGKWIDTLKENNVALNKNSYQGNGVVNELTDGNSQTQVGFTSLSEPFIVNLENETEVDMIQIHFTDSTWTKTAFSLAISTDSLLWNTVADTSIADTSLLAEGNVLKFAVSFTPANTKFVKFQAKNNGTPDDTTVFVNEVKVFESRPIHAPFIGWKITSTTSSSIRIKLLPQRTSNKGEYIRIYRQTKDSSAFRLMYNYGATLPANFTTTINYGTLNRFYISAYLNGTEITSDTVTIVSQKATAIDDKITNDLPNKYFLSQNYPNPFNPSTTIQYFLPHKSRMQLKILDLLGREIKTLVDEEEAAGMHMIDFNASALASGIYFYRMQAESFIETKKLVIIK